MSLSVTVRLAGGMVLLSLGSVLGHEGPDPVAEWNFAAKSARGFCSTP